MRETGSPEYEPPAPDQTLQQWLAGSSQDWMASQPTMWLPAVPAAPAPPSIPTQRGSGRRRASRSRPVALPEKADTAGQDPPARHAAPGALHRSGWPAMVGALFGAGLGLTPSAVAAVVALLAGGCSVAAAATRLARLGTGVRAERARRVDQAICIAAVLVAVAAVGLGGSTLWSAVTSTSAVG